MSDEDLVRAKGRALEDYLQCKARLATLEAEGKRFGILLDEVCAFLRGGKKQDRFSTGGLEEAFTVELITLMSDLHETRHRRETLHDSLVAMGLDLKD